MLFNFRISTFLKLIVLITIVSCQKEDPTPEIIQAFREDFKDNFKCWATKTGDTATVTIANDSLVIYNDGTYGSWNAWTPIQLDTTKNWSIKSSMSWKSGVTNYGYGLIWGVKNANNLNVFNVSKTGWFFIGVFKNGKFTLQKEWTYLSSINPINNTLEIKKEGEQISFIINNKVAYTSKNLPMFDNGIGFNVSNKMKAGFDYLYVTEW